MSPCSAPTKGQGKGLWLVRQQKRVKYSIGSGCLSLENRCCRLLQSRPKALGFYNQTALTTAGITVHCRLVRSPRQQTPPIPTHLQAKETQHKIWGQRPVLQWLRRSEPSQEGGFSTWHFYACPLIFVFHFLLEELAMRCELQVPPSKYPWILANHQSRRDTHMKPIKIHTPVGTSSIGSFLDCNYSFHDDFRREQVSVRQSLSRHYPSCCVCGNKRHWLFCNFYSLKRISL